ncbi:cytochrome P450 [Streptomyces sp. NPDC054945]
MTSAQNLSVPAPRTGCPLDPPSGYREATATTPVVRVQLPFGDECWLVARHDDVRAVLTDRRFSADATRPGYPIINEELRALAAASRSSAESVEESEHLRRRRMLTSDFKAKRIEALRPEIQTMVDEVLDAVMADGGPTDLMARFALPVPSAVICLVLGVPYEEHKFFEERGRVLLDYEAGPEAMATARQELMEYMLGLARAKQEQPDDGLLSRLLERGELTVEEVAGTGLILLLGGHETTAATIALSVVALLRNPEQLALLRRDPTLIKGAVDELMRYATVVQNGLGRVAIEDVEIGGQLIKAGEGVLCMLSAANRDEKAFPGGNALDVTRDARGQVSFGYGLHQCVGQSLARAEIQIAVETLLRRMPHLRLAVPFEDLRFRDRAGLYGLEQLPVVW